MIARLGISLTVGAFITTFIIRSLSVEEYGIYNVLYSLIGYVSVVASFGIPEVFRRFIPEALKKKEYAVIKGLVVRGFKLRMLLSAVTVGIILFLHGPVGHMLKLENFLDYFSIFAFSIVLALEAGLMTTVLHSLFLHKYSVIASTVYTLFRGGCAFVLLKLGWGIHGVLWAEVASWGFWTLLQWYFYLRKFAARHPSTEKAKLPLRRYVRYGGLSALNELAATPLGVSTDFFIITAFLGPGAVALYAFADRVIKLFLNCMPHLLLVDVIRPAFFTKYAESGSKQHLADMFNLLLKISAFTVFPFVAGMVVLGERMITIVFKPEYLPARYILWTLALFTAINIFFQPTGLVLKSLEQVQVLFYSKFFALYNLVAVLLVVQRFGVMGVVLVSCSAIWMKNVFLFCCMKRHVQFGVDWRGLTRIALNASVMALVILPLRSHVSNFAQLAMLALLGMGVYLLASWVNKGFNPGERGWINRAMPRPVFVF